MIKNLSGTWAMEPNGYEQLRSAISLVNRPEMRDASTAQEINDFLAGDGPFHQMDIDDNGVAHLTVSGPVFDKVPLMYRYYGIEACDMSEMESHVRSALVNESVKSMVIHMDTPGGMVAGLEELAEAIKALDDAKGVVVSIRGQCCSAGLMLASQAGRRVAGPSSDIGCIGTYIVAVDSSKVAKDEGYIVHVITNDEATVKGMGTPGTEITTSMLDFLKKRVNSANDKFIDALVSGYGFDEEKARSLATGEYWDAKEAMQLGLVDEVSSTPNLSTRQTIKETIVIDKMAALVAEYQNHAAAIVAKASQGIDLDVIKAEIIEQERVQAEAAAKAEQDAKDAELAELKASVEAKDAELAAAKAEVDRLSALAALADSAPQDPGDSPDADVPQELSKEEIFALSPAEKFNYFANLK